MGYEPLYHALQIIMVSIQVFFLGIFILVLFSVFWGCSSIRQLCDLLLLYKLL